MKSTFLNDVKSFYNKYRAFSLFLSSYLTLIVLYESDKVLGSVIAESVYWLTH